MTKDQVLELAKQAGFHFCDAGYADEGILHSTAEMYSQKCFERFATLVGNAALEEAARKCDDEVRDIHSSNESRNTAEHLATAIRNLKEPT